MGGGVHLAGGFRVSAVKVIDIPADGQRIIVLPKADVVEEICNSGDTGPAAYVAHHAQNVELFMDKGAAAYIEDPNKKMS